jgi:hypothetical protein
MDLSKNPDWHHTITGLHQAVRILGALQLLTQPETPLWLERALAPVAAGATTGRLPGMRYLPAQGPPVEIPLEAHTQRSLLVALFEQLAGPELGGLLPPGESPENRLLRAFERNQVRAAPQAEVLLGEEPFEIDRQLSTAYAAVQYSLYTALARFRARLLGNLSPLVLWPEHFDLSTIWFQGAHLDENQAHLNFGFAPFSPGLEAPYIYAYAYPYPQAYAPPPLPAGARWHTENWTGVVLPYAALASQDQPELFVEESCLQIFQGLRALLTA